MTMTAKDYEGFSGTSTPVETPVVDSMNDMFASARPSSNFDAIEINAVPDFSGVMAKMKANGEI
jgi:gamma-glutamyl:cysteine ligase YbdK (ATP-grasp superfamily)